MYFKKNVLIIGYGGMGKRYHKALKNLGFKNIDILDNKLTDELRIKKNFFSTFKDINKKRYELICLVTNTVGRIKIFEEIVKLKLTKKIILEKPLSCSIDEALKVKPHLNKYKVLVNSYRPFLHNYKMLKKIMKKKKEEPVSFTILSPSAGLGNMGSVFFDIGLYFLDEEPVKIKCQIDKALIKNPRGTQFNDPAGFGIIELKNNKRIIFDTFSDTSIPYKMIIRSKNLEIWIDEINNDHIIYEKPEKLKNKPNNYYLFKPIKSKLKIKEKYNPIKFTETTIKEIFSKKFSSNYLRSLKVMQLIIGCHVSSEKNLNIELPLKKKYFKKYIPFA